MPIQPLNLAFNYNKQRFTQFDPSDCANWYLIQDASGKRPIALYPTMGRRHVRINNFNRFIYTQEPRALFKTVNYLYVIVGATVYQYDKYLNLRILFNADFALNTGEIFWDYLPYITLQWLLISDGVFLYVINEVTGAFSTVTDPRAPTAPNAIAAFGNRFAVSGKNSTQFWLSQVGLGGDSFDPALCFSFGTFPDYSPLVAQATGAIVQMATLHNQLYVFNAFSCDIWMNIPSVVNTPTIQAQFPWKLNTSFNFDYGIADAQSLDIDFGRMTWLGQNRNGLVAFMSSDGRSPEMISTQAINALIQKDVDETTLSPFITGPVRGFLYQYEDSIFYRVVAGPYLPYGQLDVNDESASLEYNFDTKSWHRCIELNGQRNRISRHTFFNNMHLVTVYGDDTVYEMAGDIYFNELRNPNQPDAQAIDAYITYPMRYEGVSSIVSQPDYSEFITDWIQIDFVFGQSFYKSEAPYGNSEFIVDEDTDDGEPIYVVTEDGKFIITEGSDTPTLNDDFYNILFKPYIELYISDDGGVTYLPADVREFSPLGVYSWRMRWYQLGPSRNRCYKLVCVSPAPIVVLGGVQSIRKASGGAA